MNIVEIKKYFVFGITEHYPNGGLSDLEGTFDSIEELKEYFVTYGIRCSDYIEILDIKTGEILRYEYKIVNFKAEADRMDRKHIFLKIDKGHYIEYLYTN